MVLFAQKTSVISIVHNDVLHFVEIHPQKDASVVQSLSVNDFLALDADSDTTLSNIRQFTNDLLVMPNYWIGNASYEFQSNKQSLVDAFLTRKLKVDYAVLPDIIHFFNYVISEDKDNPRGIYVFFLQDTLAFQLYEKLKHFDLEPIRITTPSFVLESKVKNHISDFYEGGKCLIHMLSTECFVYFYFQGHFLFERVISLPDQQLQPDHDLPEENNPNSEILELQSTSPQDILSIVTYEINQSLFLFSQKTKSTIDKFYILTSCEIDIEGLKALLDQHIEDMTFAADPYQNPELENSIGPLASFAAADILPPYHFLTISNKALKNKLEWQPIQRAGLIIGIGLFLLLCLESLFLFNWFHSNDLQTSKQNYGTNSQARQLLEQYSQALDILILEKNRPKPKETIINMAGAIPENIMFREITVDLENNPNLDFKGSMTVSTPDKVQEALTQLAANLNTYLSISRPITIDDINFQVDPQKKQTQTSDYLVSFRVDLK